MNFDSRYHLPVPIDQVWAFLQDLGQAASCMPGVEGLIAQDDSSCAATMRVKVGPIALRLEGQVKVLERDAAAHRLVMDLEGRERRMPGTAKGTVVLVLTEEAPGETAMNLEADYQLLGRLGEMGHSVIRHKAESILDEFVERMSKKVAA